MKPSNGPIRFMTPRISSLLNWTVINGPKQQNLQVCNMLFLPTQLDVEWKRHGTCLLKGPVAKDIKSVGPTLYKAFKKNMDILPDSPIPFSRHPAPNNMVFLKGFGKKTYKILGMATYLLFPTSVLTSLTALIYNTSPPNHFIIWFSFLLNIIATVLH